ncbi:MAG: TraB/GumN family protein [Hyphomonadaceae bacterium]
MQSGFKTRIGRVVPLLLVLAPVMALAACGSDTPSFTDQVREIAEANSDEQPAMWDVSDEDTQIYLFGTVHTLRPETEWMTGRVSERIEAAKAIYFEADNESQRARDGVEIAVTQHGLYNPGQSLRDVLDDEVEGEVAEATELVGVPLAGFDTFKPWLVSATLSQMYAEELGFDSEAGVETVLGDIARASNKPLRYLETGADQMELLASIPDGDQIDMLVNTAGQILENPTQLDQMVAEWAEGDVDALSALVAEDKTFGEGPAFDIMLKGRNANWTEQIVNLLETEEGVFFIAVGAAHLVGEESVQSMLGARGLDVVRVDKRNEILR